MELLAAFLLSLAFVGCIAALPASVLAAGFAWSRRRSGEALYAMAISLVLLGGIWATGNLLKQTSAEARHG